MNEKKFKIQSFARTKGRTLTDNQSRLVRELLPKLEFKVENIHLYKDLQLEVGFGSGEHLFQKAIELPNSHFLGCEPYINGVAKLLTKIEEQKINNISIFTGDCRDIIDLCPDGTFSCVYMLFPDPWSKKKHLKRRLMQNDFLSLINRVLKVKGLFRFASDIESYAQQTLDVLRDSGKSFSLSHLRLDECVFEGNPWTNVVTKYQSKAKSAKRRLFFIEAKKN